MKRFCEIALMCLALVLGASSARADCSSTPDIHSSIQQAILQCDVAIHTHLGNGIWGSTAKRRAAGYYTRGLLYHLLGKFDLAIADYTGAMGWVQAFGDAYEARGDAYEDSGQHEKASADYAEAARLSSDGPERLAERCWARTVRGRALDRALADCNAALKALPDDKDILDTRCFLHFKMANYSAAIADCDAIEKMQKRFASALYIGGLSKRRLGDTSGGDADVAAAMDADYRIADRYALYGVTR